jgi:drug/metabolite transporter (DMT)-like permease
MSAPTSDIGNPGRPARWGAWAIALAACIWGFWGLAIRASGLSGPHVPCIVLATIAIFGIPLLPRRLPRGRAAWFALAATGATDAANALLYFEALSRGPQPVAVLSHYLAPILVALFTPLVLGTRAPRVAFFALPVSVAGLALLLGPDALTLGDALVTGALGAGSAVFYALQILIQKRFSDRLTAGELLVWHAGFGALMLLPFALTAPAPHLGGVLWLMGGAIAGGCVAGTIFLWGLGRVTAATAGVLTYVEPLVGVLVGLVAFGEPLAATAPIGGALILGAGLWVVRAAARA